MARGGITVYLPRDLETRIRRIARDQHRSESSVVAEAVKARFERGDGGAKEESADRRLNRVDIRLDKAIGESLIIKEILLLFVRVWLEHNPPIDEEMEESAAASAEARFERFLDFVTQALGPGKSLGVASALAGNDRNVDLTAGEVSA
ncbi:MAG: hypothetical protein JNM47_02550 [Hyphomonadaceae bacterium]|nr:hypothetical protein [Hyphomonadaceae bacterium]